MKLTVNLNKTGDNKDYSVVDNKNSNKGIYIPQEIKTEQSSKREINTTVFKLRTRSTPKET